MKSGKKVLSLLLVLCLIVAAVPSVFAVAEDEGAKYSVETPRGITAEPAEAEAEEEVLLTVDEGYELKEDSLKATYEKDGAAVELELTAADEGCTFEMPAADVKVEAEFDKTAGPSKEADITSFVVEDVTAVIDNTKNTVVITVRNGADVSKLTPAIEVSEYATIDPATAVEQDFTEDVKYTVTAEDGETTKEYTVSVAYRLTPADTGADEILITDEHNQYMYGYDEDHAATFGPAKNMKRSEVAAMFYNLLQDKELGEDEEPKDFADVAKTGNVWYRDAVNKISAMGIVEGFKEDGKFHPDDNITRAQFLSMASKFVTAEEVTSSETFPDIPSNAWYAEQLKKAMGASMFTGDEKGNFRPNDFITRAEVVNVVNKLLDRHEDRAFIDENEADLVKFDDIIDEETHWAYYAIRNATNSRTFEETLGGEKWLELVVIDDEDNGEDNGEDSNSSSEPEDSNSSSEPEDSNSSSEPEDSNSSSEPEDSNSSSEPEDSNSSSEPEGENSSSNPEEGEDNGETTEVTED